MYGSLQNKKVTVHVSTHVINVKLKQNNISNYNEKFAFFMNFSNQVRKKGKEFITRKPTKKINTVFLHF